MGGVLFHLNPGDQFYDTQCGQEITFVGCNEQLTSVYFHIVTEGFTVRVNMVVLEFINAYIDNRFLEVPGAGNVREVVPKGLDPSL